MRIEEWLDAAIKRGASEQQLRASLEKSGYPEEFITKSLRYRKSSLQEKKNKTIGYLLVGAGGLVTLIAIILWVLA